MHTLKQLLMYINVALIQNKAVHVEKDQHLNQVYRITLFYIIFTKLSSNLFIIDATPAAKRVKIVKSKSLESNVPFIREEDTSEDN